ncbi:hypothetical protein CROQUDRAFT_670193 [Cronartium quercuum f. sp. fusiforme G11]|uniref:FHF complex subunit HOOK-interacting protein C-terminal domain-containing protein n=1 Tax=Cronartium quercuum f. sp. fusiforme G11 TaxID=708437 RepID=A0A9P6TD73_9BASI|nr:hypothetical protein CROQUDRAFT_670193 [Cronartium quercuum f. sp. fusiforme G11]
MSFLKALFNPSNHHPSTQQSPTRHEPEPEPQSALLSFQSSWNQIKNALSSPTHRQQTLQSTDIKLHLDRLWESLAVENHIPISAMNSSGSKTLTSAYTGECVEYFLKHDVPGTLVALSLPDQPLGVKGLVIGFFLSLVVFMDEHFVVHAKVHKPLVRLLRSCVEPELDSEEADEPGWRTKESAYEEAVVEVMCHLCSRIKTFPELLAVFLHNRSRTTNNTFTSQTTQLSWPPSPYLQPATSISSSGTQSPNPYSQPSQRKSVHFSPQPRPLSPSPSVLSSAIAPSDSLNQSTLSSSTIDNQPSASRRSTPTSPLLDSLTASALKPDSDMLIFSYLLRFLHRDGRTGDLARAGLLFLMELAMGRSQPPTTQNALGEFESSSKPTKAAEAAAVAFGEWILDSDFADVLGAGIGAAYGLLPSRLLITPRHENPKSGMVLGGMGTHLEDEEEDEQEGGRSSEERERERRRNQVFNGLGVSGSEEFRAQMDLFLKLVEFAQDVLRNTTTSALHHYLAPPDPIGPGRALTKVEEKEEEEEEEEEGPTPSEIVAAAISSAVLGSIRNLFLNAIMYPSILECSDEDGSAVAVMSYLEAVLSLLETDGELADGLLRFLMTEDNEVSEPLPRTTHANRRSGVMQMIKADYNQARPRASGTGISYFNSLGRFTLKDLLINHATSPHAPTATAALKLLHVILTRHDRYALPLLDIIPDPRATAFPFPNDDDDEEEFAVEPARKTVLGHTEELESDEDEEFTYPSIVQEEDEEEAFVYPSKTEEEPFSYPVLSEPGSPPRRRDLTNQALMSTPATHTARSSFPRSSPAPTYQSHLDALEYVRRVISIIEPVSKASDQEGVCSTAFGHYLLDAEAELTGTATFRRGLLAAACAPASAIQPVPVPPPPAHHYHQRVHEWETMGLIDYPVIRHRLVPAAPLLASLLTGLRRFFCQSPETNLILTGCLASLAACPTRSLDGWLLPVSEEEEETEEEGEDFWARDRSEGNREGDDRSIDFVVDELASCPSSSRKKMKKMNLLVEGSGTNSTSVLEIYSQLAEEVERYRDSIEGFDRYLAERREGLVFVENLEDALASGSDGFGISNGIEGEKLQHKSVDVNKLPKVTKEISFFSSLFKPSPPKTSTQVRSPTTPITPDRTTNVQPFRDHYNQTRSIKLPIKSYSSPSLSLTLSSIEEVVLTPTKSTINGKENNKKDINKKQQEKVKDLEEVSLSMILDNIVILEESSKELGAIISGRKSLGIDLIRFF